MMSTFIAQAIIKEANFSLERGQAKYRAYFIKTKLYARYKDDVDSILLTTDMMNINADYVYGDCIVTE